MQYVKASEFGNVLEGHSGGVAALTFSPNGACLASAGLDAKVCIWNVSNGALLHVFVGASPMLSLTWVKDGELLCGAEDGSISVVSTSATTLHARTFPRKHNFPVEHLAMQGAARLASGAHEEVAVWQRLPEGRWIHTVDLPLPPSNSNNRARDVLVSSVHWTHSKDKGHLLLITYLHHGYIIYNTKDWLRVFTIPMNGLIAHASISPDGKLLVVSNMISGFDVYETQTGTSLGALSHAVGELLAVPVIFSPHGNAIIGGSAVGEAHVWDTNNYTLCQALPLGTSKHVLALAAYHNDAQDRFYLATGLSNPVTETAITLWYTEGVEHGKSRVLWSISTCMNSTCCSFTMYLLLGMTASMAAMLLGMAIGDSPVFDTLMWM